MGEGREGEVAEELRGSCRVESESELKVRVRVRVRVSEGVWDSFVRVAALPGQGQGCIA